jgi:hypothetical protein
VTALILAITFVAIVVLAAVYGTDTNARTGRLTKAAPASAPDDKRRAKGGARAALITATKVSLIVMIVLIIGSWLFWSAMWAWFWFAMGVTSLGVTSVVAGLIGLPVLLSAALGHFDEEKS